MNGVLLNPEQRKGKAQEIMEVMQMWNIGKADAYAIAREMMHLIARVPNEDWKDPLEGTGLSAKELGAIKIGEAVDKQFN